ncbi:hypothetical protein [Halomonas urumqiensis]|uniref:Multidrug transporter n=1 Tax=Halomonas urumqiensis TaxID=1684789 RepID=A0A2N7ULE3_9GAMM|nr:hypothetical protein [Halomonas urumqiensis]PMR81246.1 hypothetical protein C1H70_05925 [Halomonas urumqiensis]PTB01743.1 hypothetical protein C6V82_13785 [Halomonas urumqiensis]GHE22160.1 hypothetical protein GCM10017767_26810 [Halomonas urumqiensis]
MKRSGKRTTLLTSLTLAVMLVSLPAVAQEQHQRHNLETQPGGGAMILDALVARPLLAAATLGGTALFVVSLPFSALGGNMEGVAETLVMTPARATFKRCLGCTNSLPPSQRQSSGMVEPDHAP